MVTKEELRGKIQRLKEEYTSGSITKEDYQRRVLEIKRDLELLKRETYEKPQKKSNKKLLVIPLLIILILPVSYFLLKENVTESKNSDIYVLKNEGESWPTLQGNPQRTGIVHGEIPDNVEMKWKFEASGGFGIVCAYGRVYFGDYLGYFYCVDGDTGELIWYFHPDESRAVGMNINSFPTIYDKKVYFYNHQGEVYCLSAVDGSKVWEYKVQRVPLLGITAVVTGKFYMIYGDSEWGGVKNVICLDANTGKLIWNYKNEKEIMDWNLCVNNDKIVVSSEDSLMVLNKDTGQLIWDKKFKYATLVISYNNKIYFSSEDRWYCLNANSGEIIWEKEYGKTQFSFGASIINNRAFFYTLKDKIVRVYCVNTDTGEIIWEKESDRALSTPITDEKKILFTNFDNMILCFSVENGEELWSWNVGKPIFSLVYMDKKIYYWGDDGHVYCIGER